MAEASNAGKEISLGENTELNVRPFSPASGAGDGELQETKGHVGILRCGPSSIPAPRPLISDGVMKDLGCWAPALITFIPLLGRAVFWSL